jgi:site-specific recombinase XerD
MSEQTSAIAVHDGKALDLADVQPIIAAWLEHEQQEGASPATLAAYDRGMAVWLDWLKGRAAPGHPTPATVQEYKLDLAGHYSVQTCNLRLTAIRSFYRYCVANDIMPVNPAASVKGVKRPKSTTRKRAGLTPAEVLAVLETCDLGTLTGIRDYAMLVLMAYCGLRTIEVQRANLGDLRTEGERLTLRVQGKGHTEADERAIIPREKEAAIRAWLAHRRTFRKHGDGDSLFVVLSNRGKGERLGLRAIRAMVKDRFWHAGVTGDKSTHSLRHSAITAAVRAAKRSGRSPLDVQAFARHRSFDTTMIYVHEADRLDNPIEDQIDYGEV